MIAVDQTHPERDLGKMEAVAGKTCGFDQDRAIVKVESLLASNPKSPIPVVDATCFVERYQVLAVLDAIPPKP